MLSRKNVKLMSQKQQPRKQRFGIRKLSIGVVSVLLGLLFIGGGQGALADDLAAASNAASTVSNLTTVESTSTAASTTASDQTVAASSASNDSSVASTVPAASTTDSVVSTPSSTNDVPTSQAVPSQQPTAPVVSDTPASTPVISDQPADSAVPDSQLPAVSAAPSVDSGASINSAAKEEVTENDTAAAVTPPAAAQPGNKEASQSGVQTVDKIHTDQILKDKYGIDVNHLDAKSVLLLASLFHIFANEANLGADMNGNVAVGILNSNVDFGTRGESINLTKGDIYYIQQLNAALQSGSFRNENFNHVIFGQDVNIEIINGQVYVNGHHMVNLKPEEVFKDGAGTNYIDFPAVFQRLLKAANFYAGQDESAGVIKDFTDMNNRFVDVSNAVPKDNVIYVNIPYEYLTAPQPIKIYGLSSKVGGPTVVINVIGMPAGGEVAIQTQIKFYYDDEKNNSVSPSENHAYPNHVLWNFNDSAAHILIQSGYFMGSILAPNATVTANVNVDGNIVANIVNVKGGESHKWDIHPVEPPSFIEIPTEPTQPTQPTQPSQPTQPDKPVEPEQPTEQPSQPSEQPSQPTQPTQPSQPSQPSQPTQPTQPSTPIKPDKPVEPEQPTNPQPTEPEQPSQPTEQPSQPTNPGEPIVPPTEDDFAGATPDPQPTPQPAPNPEKTPVSPIPASSAAVSAQQPVVTTSKSSVATAAPATSPAAALPQTGNDSHGVLLGIALAIAAQLMIWGLAQPKKKK